MNYYKFNELDENIQKLIGKAQEAATHSQSSRGHRVGAAILCKNGDIFVGATNARTRVIGSTCAERMAVDQLCYYNNMNPIICVLTGLIIRKNWSESSICIPCGVCLEMFWELIMRLNCQDIEFICVSWNKSRILKIKLSELYPRIEAVSRY